MSNHYTAQTAIDYKTLLHHFKQQAAGSKKVALLPSYLMTNGVKRTGGSSVVIIDRPKHEISTPAGDKLPAMEVMDESEAGRRRAESELEHDDALTERVHSSSHQSMPDNPDRKTAHSGRKRTYKQSTKNQKVKRARDIFD